MTASRRVLGILPAVLFLAGGLGYAAPSLAQGAGDGMGGSGFGGGGTGLGSAGPSGGMSGAMGAGMGSGSGMGAAGAEPGALEAVNVRARRSLEERFASPGSRVIIGRDDIDRMGADSVADVLRQLPGVQTSGAASGSLEIRMRGMDRNATQILIDGERVGGRRSAQLPFEQLPADLIERVEVIRAPTAEHGGAAGGTINIVLKEALINRETNMRVTNQHLWGRNGLQAWFSRTGPLNEPPPRVRPADGAAPASSPAASLPSLPAAPYRPWSYFLGTAVSERLTGNDRVRDTITSTGAETSEEIARNRGREIFLLPRINGRLSAVDQIILRPMVQVGESEGGQSTTASGTRAGAPRSYGATDTYGSDRYMVRLRGDWTRRLESSRLEVKLSGQTAGEDARRQRSLAGSEGGTPFTSGLDYSDWRRERELSTSAKLTGGTGTHLWTLGGEWEQRSIGDHTSTLFSASDAPAATSPTTRAFDSLQRRTILWAQDEWTVLGRSTLTGGLRMDMLSRATDSDGARFDERRTQWQPTLHWRQPLAEGWQLRANLARTSQVPSLVDVIDRVVPSVGQNTPTRPDVTGNPSLKAQTTLALDAGVERRLSGLATGGQAGLNAFVRQIDDVIVRRVTETDGRWLQRPENAGQALVWGLEADLRLPLSRLGLPMWSLNTNASLLQSRLDTAGAASGRIPGQPHYLLNINLAKPMPRSAGMFGGVSLNLTGASDLGDGLGASGRQRAVPALDVFVGQMVQGLGFWRLGVANVGNPLREQVRYDRDATGALRSERAIDQGATAVYLTVGTRF